MKIRKLAQVVAIVLSAACVGGCARTVVQPETEMRDFGLTRPRQIIVYDFAVTEAEATEHGSTGTKSNKTDGGEGVRDVEKGRQVAKALAEELARGLTGLGFTVERKPRGTPIRIGQLLIDGEFLDVEEGNRLERLVIGFGVGSSKIDAEVHVYYGALRRKLLDFRTHSDSGKMPGAAATVGAGVAVTGAVTAATAVGSAAAGAVKEYQSELERMAAHSADQAVTYLSEFFAKQGWTGPDQTKHPAPGK